MKLGMIGLPNVGKSTLFNALSTGKAGCANYPFCTIEPNVGLVSVPDYRIDFLSDHYKPKRTTYATLEFVDIAGLVKGASKGEGLGNKFLANIREVNAIIHVVRCFENSDIIHVNNKIDPISDIETINLELIFSDIETLKNRIVKLEKQYKADKSLAKCIDLFKRLLNWLENGKNARSFKTENEDEYELVKSLNLLSFKPVIYAANLSEYFYKDSSREDSYLKSVELYAHRNGSVVFPICAKLEEELTELEEADKSLFLNDLGLKESGLFRVVKASYNLLGLISYITAGFDEVKAWTVKQGTKAPQAAGKIHSDFERGFICAEVVSFDDFKKFGSMSAIKDKGLLRIEGKQYEIQDGDIILFKFNV